MASSKFVVGILATCLIAVGIAAQTGTVHLARPASRPNPAPVTHRPVQVAEPPQPQVVQPAPAAPQAPPPAAAPVQPSGGQGEGEGDGGDGGGD